MARTRPRRNARRDIRAMKEGALTPRISAAVFDDDLVEGAQPIDSMSQAELEVAYDRALETDDDPERLAELETALFLRRAT